MADQPFIARGFRGRRSQTAEALRLPPGQYETKDFPVLSAGPTPRTSLSAWDFAIRDADGRSSRWSWDEFQALPRDTPTVDIHCVDQVVKVRDEVGRRVGRHAARRRHVAGGRKRAVCARLLRRRVYDQPPTSRRDRGQSVGCFRLRRRGVAARARRTSAAARASPVLLEEREVGARAAAPTQRQAGLLGAARLPRPWGPVA